MNTVLDKDFSIDKTDWIKVKLGDVVAEPKESVKDFSKEQIEHVVGLEHINSEDIHLRRSESMEESTTFTKKFSTGDVLFGRRRAYLKKAAQASFSGICSGDITVMRVKDGLSADLLPFVIHNEKFFDYAVTHSAGGLSPRVKFKDLANYEFLLPPKEQQSQLAELLWAIDDSIETDKKLLGCIKTNYQVEIENAVPRGSLEFWIMGDVVKTRKGVTYKSADYSDQENGLPLLNLKSIEKGGGFNSDGIKYYDGNYQNRHFVTDHDLIVACTDITRDGNVVGYPLHPSVYQGKKMLFTMDLIAIEIIENNLLRDYLYYALKSKWVHWFLFAYSPGTTVLHLDLSGMNKLKIPKLKVDEQKIIIERLKKIEDSIAYATSKISSLQNLQRTLINRVF